jgi:hypothetical protein
MAERKTQQYHQAATGFLSSFLSSSSVVAAAAAGENAGLRTVRPLLSTTRLPLVMVTTTGSKVVFSSAAIPDRLASVKGGTRGGRENV